MEQSLKQLVELVRPDEWRASVGFSEDVESIHGTLFDPELSEDSIIALLNGWLQRYQPCLFGRLGAKLGLLTFCILREADLGGADDAVRDKIQRARTDWTRSGFFGERSGFVVVLLSRQIALGVPGAETLAVAKRLGSLYLLEDVKEDQIYLDELFLEKPGGNQVTWRWDTGINYFCAQGDKRWWQDHRFPGGIAFSVNSVGHMAKAGLLARSMRELDELLGTDEQGWVASRIDSLEKALEFAMRTIYLASDHPASGRATYLRSMPQRREDQPVVRCPVKLPSFLEDKDFCSYEGYYHTDVTLPSEYFRPDVERARDQRIQELDFTYLFDAELENPDYIRAGTGRRIRATKPTSRWRDAEEEAKYRQKKRGRGGPREVRIEEHQRLVRAIGQ